MRRTFFTRRIVGLSAPIAILLLLASSFAVLAYTAPTFPELAEGEKMIAKRQWQDAEAWFYDFVKAHPNHPEGLLKMGLVELRRPGGDSVRARQYLDRATKADPDNPIGLFLYGKACEVDGRRDEALKTYDRLIKMGPGKDNPPRAAAVHLARFNRGLFAALDKDFVLAKDLFGQVLAREPQQAYATWELALIAADEGNIDEAIEWGRKTIQNVSIWAPSEAWPYPQGRYGYLRENSRYELAKLLLKKGKNAEVEELLKPIVDRVARRPKSRTGSIKPMPKSPLESTPDERYQDSAFYYADALIAEGRVKEAKKLLKAFSRQAYGSSTMKALARKKAKKL